MGIRLVPKSDLSRYSDRRNCCPQWSALARDLSPGCRYRFRLRSTWLHLLGFSSVRYPRCSGGLRSYAGPPRHLECRRAVDTGSPSRLAGWDPGSRAAGGQGGARPKPRSSFKRWPAGEDVAVLEAIVERQVGALSRGFVPVDFGPCYGADLSPVTDEFRWYPDRGSPARVL